MWHESCGKRLFAFSTDSQTPAATIMSDQVEWFTLEDPQESFQVTQRLVRKPPSSTGTHGAAVTRRVFLRSGRNVFKLMAGGITGSNTATSAYCLLPIEVNLYDHEDKLTAHGYAFNRIVKSVNRGRPDLTGLPEVLAALYATASGLAATLSGEAAVLPPVADKARMVAADTLARKKILWMQDAGVTERKPLLNICRKCAG